MPQAMNKSAFGNSSGTNAMPCTPQSVTADAPIRYAPPHHASARMLRSCSQSTSRNMPSNPVIEVASMNSVA